MATKLVNFEISRESLVTFTIMKEFIAAFRSGPATWIWRGESFVENFPAYRALSERVFIYVKEVAQGPPELSIETCRNGLNGLDMFHRTPFTKFKKRPKIVDCLDRIGHLYEEVRTLRPLADIASPKPNGRSCSQEPDEILSRFGVVGFDARVRDDLRILRNGWVHKGIRYEEDYVRVYDEHGELKGSFDAERIKFLDTKLYELFVWGISALAGAIWENPSLLIMIFVLGSYEPEFLKSWQSRWETVKRFNPSFFKTRKPRPSKKLQKQPTFEKTFVARWVALLGSIPEDLSIEDLRLRISMVLLEIAAEFQAIATDTARFLRTLANQSAVPNLQAMILSGVVNVQEFAAKPLVLKDFELEEKRQLPAPESA